VESLDCRPRKSKAPGKKTPKAAKTDEKGARQAAHAYERARERRERQRQKEETAAAKARARRHAAVSNAEAALESARREHEATAAKIEKDRAAMYPAASLSRPKPRCSSSPRRGCIDGCITMSTDTKGAGLGITFALDHAAVGRERIVVHDN
jgi:hypothetical protein